MRGFEDVWRPPVRPRRVWPEAVLGSAPDDVRARLRRLAARAPEVLVKVTGRTRDPAHLQAHLDYVTRKGELEAWTRDGLAVRGREDVRDLAVGWAAADLLDRRRRADAPMSLAVVLSMPRDTDPLRLRAAAAAFAQACLAERHDYLLVLHTDAGHPHVHLTVRARGDGGERLNPRKADLEAWRQRFALELRLRGVEAEATPRRARGITLKAERTPLRKLRERFEAGRGPMPHRQRAALREAAGLLLGRGSEGPWAARIAARQLRIRRLYLAQARLLQSAEDPADRALGRAVERFLRGMPAPASRRLALARELRAAAGRPKPPPERGR